MAGRNGHSRRLRTWPSRAAIAAGITSFQVAFNCPCSGQATDRRCRRVTCLDLTTSRRSGWLWKRRPAGSSSTWAATRLQDAQTSVTRRAQATGWAASTEGRPRARLNLFDRLRASRPGLMFLTRIPGRGSRPGRVPYGLRPRRSRGERLGHRRNRKRPWGRSGEAQSCRPSHGRVPR